MNGAAERSPLSPTAARDSESQLADEAQNVTPRAVFPHTSSTSTTPGTAFIADASRAETK